MSMTDPVADMLTRIRNATMRRHEAVGRAPRRVTLQPIDTPSRNLKPAIDLRALVTNAFCPVIWPSSLTAASRSLALLVASPIPTLITTFSIRGTCIGLR